jgi:hypothetical protein
MNDQSLSLRGREAQALLDNPMLAEAMATMRQATIDQWKETDLRDQQGQLLLLQLAKVTDRFEGLLRGIVDTGKLAQRRIDLNAIRDEPQARRFMRKVFSN